MNGTRDIKVLSGLFLTIFIFLSGIGCENPGSVGRQIDDSNINVADTTIYIPSTSVDSVDTYSGLLDVFSSGIFDDPLFGRVEATSLLKPSLLAFDEVIGPNAVMKLRLQYNSKRVYGDSTSQADFEIIELDEIWRGKAWKYNDLPPLPDNSGMISNTVASFSISNQDSIEVTLWAELGKQV
ncbi:MAG: hypothetical protein U5J95_09040 [Balneolaceae bacterium]|nr:hypothetical protein [Balneolaceae bacterium]